MHKLLLATVLASVVSIGFLPGAKGDANLFPLGNMEEPNVVNGVTIPKGWEKPPANLTISQDSGLFSEGENSLRITLNETGQGWVRTQVMPVQPGKTYDIRFSMRLSSPGNLPFCGVRIYDSQKGWIPSSGYLVNSQQSRDWVKKEARFTVSPEARWIYVGFLVKGDQEASVNIDDLTITAVD